MRVLVCIFALTLTAHAQFRAGTRLVIVPVSVQDATGKSIDGLTANQFLLLDKGERRTATLDVTFLPISLAVVVQTNSDAAAALRKVNKVGSLLEPLLTGDKGSAAVIAFGPDVETKQDLTSDFGKVQKALASLKSGGSSAHVNDAVDATIDLLAHEPKDRRRVMLLICDGKDSGSKSKLEDVVGKAQQQNVLIYALTFSRYMTPFTVRTNELPPSDGFDPLAVFREIRRAGKEGTAESLAKYTGGRRASFLKQNGLEKAIGDIAAEIHSQYLLSFTAPAGEPGIFHPITVSVPSRADARVRARPGYWQVQAE